MQTAAFYTYYAVMSVTPGPNNLMLTSSGINFGLRRTWPHLLGVSLGSALQLLLTALCLAWIMQWLDVLRLPLALLGCAYLFRLSWQLLRSHRPGQLAGLRPMKLTGAILFQWVNPKAWVMNLNTVILFMPTQGTLLWNACYMSIAAILVNLPCIFVWAAAGDRLRRWLQRDSALVAFNITMAVLMAGTALWLVNSELHQYAATQTSSHSIQTHTEHIPAEDTADNNMTKTQKDGILLYRHIGQQTRIAPGFLHDAITPANISVHIRSAIRCP